METLPYLKEISLKIDKIENFGQFPFTIPAIKNLDHLQFSPTVTFIIGENGSGKSTLVEAIAVVMGFNPASSQKRNEPAPNSGLIFHNETECLPGESYSSYGNPRRS